MVQQCVLTFIDYFWEGPENLKQNEWNLEMKIKRLRVNSFRNMYFFIWVPLLFGAVVPSLLIIKLTDFLDGPLECKLNRWVFVVHAFLMRITKTHTYYTLGQVSILCPKIRSWLKLFFCVFCGKFQVLWNIVIFDFMDKKYHSAPVWY